MKSPSIQTVGNAIHFIKLIQVIGVPNTYPLESDIFGR